MNTINHQKNREYISVVSSTHRWVALNPNFTTCHLVIVTRRVSAVCCLTARLSRFLFLFSVGQLCFLIRQRVSLRPEEALFFFVNNSLPPSSSPLSAVYEVSDQPFLKEEEKQKKLTHVRRPARPMSAKKNNPKPSRHIWKAAVSWRFLRFPLMFARTQTAVVSQLCRNVSITWIWGDLLMWPLSNTCIFNSPSLWWCFF